MSRFGDISIDSLPPHAQAKARAILARESTIGTTVPAGPPALLAVKPMRVPKAAQMNKTETRFSLRLEAQRIEREIADYQFQPFTLQLAPGLRYTPDFAVWTYETINTYQTVAVLSFVEVKGGFVRDDARAKLLMAAKAFPLHRFTLAQYIKGEWHLNEIAR